MTLPFPKPVKLTLAQRRKVRAKVRAEKRRTAPLSPRKLEKIADELHSVWLRASRPGCELWTYPEHRAKSCSGIAHPSEMQCAHGWSRGCKALRFDPANTYSACPACHTKYTRGQQTSDAQWHDWMALRLGEYCYQELRARSRTVAKWQPLDLCEVIRDRVLWIHGLPDTLHKEWALTRVASMQSRIRRALENTVPEGRVAA